MSEWIDFCAYATQAILLCITLPRWGSRFTRPMLNDRNPEWTAANPGIVARLENGGWWMKTIQAWGIITVLVLLAFRLDLQPRVLSSQSLDTPSWEVLMTTSNLLLAVGLVLFFYGLVSGYRWVKRLVPLAERRQATLKPRSLDDFVPRWLQYLAYALVAANILARPVVDAYFPGHIKDVWGPVAIQIFISALAFLCTVGGVARAPNQFDRTLGPAYRRMEVRVGFCIMTGVAVSGLVYLWLEFSGFDSRRYGAVITSLFVSATFAAFTLLPGLPRDGTPGGQADNAPARARISHSR
jgi:hypothetical protein